jgi:hypothetical protein
MFDFLAAQEDNPDAVRVSGDTIALQQQAQRRVVAKILVVGGFCFSKVEDEVSGFRQLLEFKAGKLDPRGLRDLIPSILKTEKDLIRKELLGVKAITIIFDGSTMVCEVSVLLVRWFDFEECDICQRLIAVSMLQRTMNGNELVFWLTNKLVREYQVPSVHVHASCRDGAAVNTKAIQTMAAICPFMQDIICCSHSASLAGDKLDCPAATHFISVWSNLIVTSNIAKQRFVSAVCHAPKRKSKVRWGAFFQVQYCVDLFFEMFLISFLKVVKDVFENFDVVKDIVTDVEDDFGPALRANLRTYLGVANLETERNLLRELAVIVDAGVAIYDFVYNFEGDGLLAPRVYAAMEVVRQKLLMVVDHHQNCPTLRVQVLLQHPLNVARQQQVVAEACEKVRPALLKFDSMFTGDGKLQGMMTIYRGLRLLCPHFMRTVGEDHDSVIADIDRILLIPAFAQEDVREPLRAGVIAELPLYFVTADGAAEDADLLRWWRIHKNSLPNWYRVLGEAAILQPSSAAAERVFSILKWMFGDRQNSALEDRKEAGLVMRYNAIQRAGGRFKEDDDEI